MSTRHVRGVRIRNITRAERPRGASRGGGGGRGGAEDGQVSVCGAGQENEDEKEEHVDRQVETTRRSTRALKVVDFKEEEEEEAQEEEVKANNRWLMAVKIGTKRSWTLDKLNGAVCLVDMKNPDHVENLALTAVQHTQPSHRSLLAQLAGLLTATSTSRQGVGRMDHHREAR